MIGSGSAPPGIRKFRSFNSVFGTITLLGGPAFVFVFEVPLVSVTCITALFTAGNKQGECPGADPEAVHFSGRAIGETA